MENLGEADIVARGSDVTVVGWGAQMRVLEEVRLAGLCCIIIIFQQPNSYNNL